MHDPVTTMDLLCMLAGAALGTAIGVWLAHR